MIHTYTDEYDKKCPSRTAETPSQSYMTPLIPKSSAMITAAFSPMTSAVEYVFAPTLDGHIDKSATLSPWTPYTLRRGSSTPPR